MALLTPLAAAVAGTPVAYSAASASDTIAVTPRSMVLCRNGSAGSVTVTIDSATLVDEVAYGPITVAVPAGADRLIAVPPRLAGADGLVTITYTATANVTIAHLSGA